MPDKSRVFDLSALNLPDEPPPRVFDLSYLQLPDAEPETREGGAACRETADMDNVLPPLDDSAPQESPGAYAVRLFKSLLRELDNAAANDRDPLFVQAREYGEKMCREKTKSLLAGNSFEPPEIGLAPGENSSGGADRLEARNEKNEDSWFWRTLESSDTLKPYAPEIRKYVESPTDTKGAWDWLTNALPKSAARLGIGLAEAPFDIAQTFAGQSQAATEKFLREHPEYEWTIEHDPMGVSMQSLAAMSAAAGIAGAAEMIAKGAAAQYGKLLGIDTEKQTWSWDTFKDAWVNHTAESLAAILPFGAMFLMRRGIIPSETRVRELVDSAVKDEKTPLGQELKTELEQGPPQEELDLSTNPEDASGTYASEIQASGTGAVTTTQLEANKAAGMAFEQAVGADLEKDGLKVNQQITIKTETGVRTRVDFLTLDPITGEIGCIECKASSTASLTKNQSIAFPNIGQSGGMIAGKGKPDFPGGTQIPPTEVKIIRGSGKGEN